LIQGLAAAMACAAVAGAQASVATEIDVSDFHVQLKALAPGATPAVSFSSAMGSTSESASSFGNPPTQLHRDAASGQAFGQTATAAMDGPYAGGAAAIEGNVFDAGAFIRTAAYASSLVAQSSGVGTIGLVNDVSTASFTLAPWTVMTISASVNAMASSTGANPFEVADSGLLMAIGDAEGTGPQFAYVNFDALAIGAFGAFDDHESTVVSLSYFNDSDQSISGVFSGYVSSFASSGQAVSTVPEPAAAALWLAALIAGGLFQRRRANVIASPQ
jgi:MYXO-CTERM domain-containing protein